MKTRNNLKKYKENTFFLRGPKEKETEVFIALPKKINTILALSQYLFNNFLLLRGYANITNEVKAMFLSEILKSNKRNDYSLEESLERLSIAILSFYEIKKNSLELPLNTKDRQHVEYCIQKELKTIAKEFNINQ